MDVRPMVRVKAGELIRFSPAGIMGRLGHLSLGTSRTAKADPFDATATAELLAERQAPVVGRDPATLVSSPFNIRMSLVLLMLVLTRRCVETVQPKVESRSALLTVLRWTFVRTGAVGCVLTICAAYVMVLVRVREPILIPTGHLLPCLTYTLPQ